MTDNRVQMTDGRGGERWGWFGFQVSAYFLPLRQGEYPQGEGV